MGKYIFIININICSHKKFEFFLNTLQIKLFNILQNRLNIHICASKDNVIPQPEPLSHTATTGKEALP